MRYCVPEFVFLFISILVFGLRFFQLFRWHQLLDFSLDSLDIFVKDFTFSDGL